MRIVLADSQTLVRAGLRQLIEKISGMQVVGEAGDGQQLLELIGLLHPDAALCEIQLPQMSGLEALTQIRRHYPQVQVLMVSSHSAAHYVRTAIKVGAAGFLVKDAEPLELELALHALRKHQTYLSPSVADSAMERRRNPRLEDHATLSIRQRQVLKLIAKGRSTKEIAALLGVSNKTVETHRTRAMQTLGLHGINALMRYAMQNDLESSEI